MPAHWTHMEFRSPALSLTSIGKLQRNSGQTLSSRRTAGSPGRSTRLRSARRRVAGSFEGLDSWFHYIDERPLPLRVVLTRYNSGGAGTRRIYGDTS